MKGVSVSVRQAKINTRKYATISENGYGVSAIDPDKKSAAMKAGREMLPIS
jgi:hypothetical protein